MNLSFTEIKSPGEFEKQALELFYLQAKHVPVYRDFLKQLGKNPDEIKKIEEIPFLPVSFFKSHRVFNEKLSPKIEFSSSSTSGRGLSRHFVSDISIYETSFLKAFELFYGSPGNMTIFALLPSYLERGGSSLIFMAENFVKRSKDKNSGFFLNDLSGLKEKAVAAKAEGKKVLILGVTFALLELAEKFTFDASGMVIMETGGMKGRRKEMIREEVHGILCSSLNSGRIHSEYGMTELLSQAYSQGNGIFHCPPWMKIMIRDPNDPFSLLPNEKTGGINVIDLANIESCAFIATDDLGKSYPGGSFEILGRFDASEVRGCNLMYQF